ncbi:Gcn5-related n-acetyltransferase [Globisporangium polare]
MPSAITTSLSKESLRFEIRQYAPEDRDQVLTLIGDGLLDYAPVGHPHHAFWVGYIENSMEDVADIPGHYLSPGSNFFVVAATSSTAGEKSANEIIVATTGVEKRSDSVAELRRVSVKSEFQRFGLGRMLLNHAHEWGKTRGYEKVLARTAIIHVQALQFYESLGYTVASSGVLIADPLVEVSYFEKLI